MTIDQERAARAYILMLVARIKQPKMVCVWDFYVADKSLRVLSEHGGDEDWVIFVPSGLEEPNWIYSAPFYHDPQKIELGSDCGTIYISAHS